MPGIFFSSLIPIFIECYCLSDSVLHELPRSVLIAPYEIGMLLAPFTNEEAEAEKATGNSKAWQLLPVFPPTPRDEPLCVPPPVAWMLVSAQRPK